VAKVRSKFTGTSLGERTCKSMAKVAYPGIFFGGKGGAQQIPLRTGDRENGDLREVAP
jgi:hypothetical protein